MAGWLTRCFRGPQGAHGEAARAAQADGVEIYAQQPAQQGSVATRNILYTPNGVSQDAIMITTVDVDQFADAEPAAASLEEARQVIRKLKARLHELEGSGAAESLLHSATQPSDGAFTPKSISLSGRRGSEFRPTASSKLLKDSEKGLEPGEDTKTVPHLFRTFDKQELVFHLRKGGKPTAAVLLQAVCEADLASVPPALLLDVDPAFGVLDVVAGASELMAALQNGKSSLDSGHLAVADQLPGYLRLRLYLMQALAARPMLAHANAAARTLFEVRSDRQLQLVLEAQVQQDAMLAMLLQELLDEMLSAPVDRTHAPTLLDVERGNTIMLHSLSHFVNTNNPKVFPFVPVTMRGCGYRKTSGEVVPCVLLEFAPDSNQGAFLEHLQRDYTMMGRMSSIITLFTLKGEVLHQNAGSIAYFGYQRNESSKRQTRRAHTDMLHSKRPGAILGEKMGGEHIRHDDPPVLSQLFQYTQPDVLEGMLESMVQGGIWKSILPVPMSLAPANRLKVSQGEVTMASSIQPHAASICGDPDCIFTADGNLFRPSDAASFAEALTDRSSKPDVFEGSFALERNNKPVRLSPSCLNLGSRMLKVVPEQSQEVERTSFHGKPAATEGSQAVPNTIPGVPESREMILASLTGRSKSVLPAASSRGALPLKVPRRCTTFSTIPRTSGGEVDMSSSSNGGFATGGNGPGPCNTARASSGTRLSRIRRRSCFPMALDGNHADALSQSTWGLLGSAAYDSRASMRDTAADAEPAADVRASWGRRAVSSALARLAAGNLAAVHVAVVPGTSSPTPHDGGGMPLLRRSNTVSHPPLPVTTQSPQSQHPQSQYPQSQYPQSVCSQADQTAQPGQWQLRNSQWQVALHSQSQHSVPTQAQLAQAPATWVIQQQHAFLSHSSSSPVTQSSLVCSRPGVIAAGLDAPETSGPRRSGEGLPRRLRSVAFGDGMPSPPQGPTRVPSASSLISPQQSAYQHTDSNLTSGTTAIASAFDVTSEGPRARVPVAPQQGGLFLSSSQPPGGHASSGLVVGSFGSRSQGLHHYLSMSNATGVGAVADRPAPTGPGLNSTGSTRARRGPMRQSERSNPSVQLPASYSSVNTAASNVTTSNADARMAGGKPATSFSFGSTNAPQRPLVRMMSFLSAAPPGQQQVVQMRQYGAQPRASSSSYAGDVSSRPGSGKPVAFVDSGLAAGGAGVGGLLSFTGSRHQSGGLASNGSNAMRRQSIRHAHTAMLRAATEVGESSSAMNTTARGLSQEVVASPLMLGAEAEESQVYHEITATPFLDPVSKSQVVMVVQTDVTARVRLERRLADVMEAEHKLLENIFPRHVLEHIANTAAVNQNSGSQFNLSMLSVMPDPTSTATDHEQVTILFADIVGFTSMCKEVPAKSVMKFLNDLYTRFDALLDIYGVYKVETIGDCYMVAGGLISKDADGFAAVRKGTCDNLQAWRVLSFAKAMLRDAQKVVLPTTQEPVKMRVGIHTGPVVSGVVGTRMPRFCLFGDTINTASRMESTCPYGRIQVSHSTHALVLDEDWEATGGVQVKGKGMMETFLLKPVPSAALPTALVSASYSMPGGPDSQPSASPGGVSRLSARGPGITDGGSVPEKVGEGEAGRGGEARKAAGRPAEPAAAGREAGADGSSSGKAAASFLFTTVD